MSGTFTPDIALRRAGGRADIGQCKSVKVTCVSEVGWWDDQKTMASILALGGMQYTDQWQTAWAARNTVGSCTLVEVEGLDGGVRRRCSWAPAGTPPTWPGASRLWGLTACWVRARWNCSCSTTSTWTTCGG